MSYFETENFVPRVEEEKFPKGQAYRAKFIEAGPVGYKEGTYLLLEDALPCLANSIKGCPVIVGHQDILDQKDMEEKAIGYVAGVDYCEATGAWIAEFVVFDPKTIEKIDKGELPYVSCGYRADLTEGVTINNVKYKHCITGGTMMHLALVKNPRYNGTDIWKNSTDDVLVSDGFLYNQKENIMWGIKKHKVELDNDIMVETASGEKTIKDLVNELEAANATIAEQAAKITDLEAQVETLKAEPAKTEEVVSEQVQPETVETPVEEKPVETPVETDAGLKKDLNNALTENAKVRVIQVPNVKI